MSQVVRSTAALVRDSSQLLADLVTWSPSRPPRRDYRSTIRRLQAVSGGRSTVPLVAVARHRHRESSAPSMIAEGSDLLDSDLAEIVAVMRREGVAVLPWRMSAADCAEIMHATENASLVVLDREAVGRRVCLGEVRTERLLATDAHTTLSIAAVQRQLVDPRPFMVAERYLGAPVSVGGRPFLRWSLPSRMSEDDFMKETGGGFHTDCDGLAAVRLHIYLTDVDPGDAPLQCIPQSHSRRSPARKALRKRLRGATERAAVDRMLGPEAIRELTGPSGTMILTDSTVFHSATQARNGPRLCLTISYTATAFNSSAVLRRVPVAAADSRFANLVASGDSAMSEFSLR